MVTVLTNLKETDVKLQSWTTFLPTFSCEPINMTEYACRLANVPSVNVIQFDACQDYILRGVDNKYTR